MDTSLLPILLGLATLLPLISFFVILTSGKYLAKPVHGGYIAAGAIVAAGMLSFWALAIWLVEYHDHFVPHETGHASVEAAAGGESPAVRAQSPDPETAPGHSGDEEPHAAPQDDAAGHHAAAGKVVHTGDYYLLGQFGDLRLTISYYIDALTIGMFCMVTLIASCIHFYAMGYMHDEEHDVTDHEVSLADGSHLHRPGRYYRFFQYMSLFCFSMLGLVLAGNIAMVFVFWELVGICSYFLIGFYVERKSASTAANKAFIVNRVGDFGMIIGLMAIWAGLGTFAFGDIDANDNQHIEASEQGIFTLVRPGPDHGLTVPDGMVRFSAREHVAEIVRGLGPEATGEELEAAVAARVPAWSEGDEDSPAGHGYWLLIVAGAGIFCGCVGKSAQFPLHTWLPDAMEGPTPVSALVHSATMVAAGVYLVGRFFPVFTAEVLLLIAATGCITLFLAATIALTATDIKRVLAYSTVSQLGYMMLALGVGGWVAGLLHLITHAFFKSLLFLCSGSVIHAVHTNEMPEMGGLRRKMPITAYTMLIGCLAIAGISVPFVVGFSGYYSKDAILEQAFSFMTFEANASIFPPLFFAAAAGGAALTAFYMFRLWYLTFAGKPRNQHRYDHAHESPMTMCVPLLVLAVFATAVAWKPFEAMLVAAGLAVLLVVLGLRYAAVRPEGDAALSMRRVLLVVAVSAGGLLLAASAVGVYMQTLSPHDSMLTALLEHARPDGTLANMPAALMALVWPNEHLSHVAEIKVPVTLLATVTALGGITLATVMYALGLLNPVEVRRQFEPIYRFLLNKWWFDELYDFLFVRPVHVISRVAAGFDRRLIDGLVDGAAAVTRRFAAVWDLIADRGLVDGSVNLMAGWTYSVGLWLHGIQTGRLRQYIMFIVVGLIAIFLVISFFWTSTLAN